jgi:hypothetical protein
MGRGAAVHYFGYTGRTLFLFLIELPNFCTQLKRKEKFLGLISR